MTRNVLFLCTGNSARSILAEAIINQKGTGRFKAYSAGSHPRGVPNPLAIELLEQEGHDVSGLRSKSWTEFAALDAPFLHCVITVCDNAKGETCPIWPGHPIQTHWGIPDPAGMQDDGRPEDFRIAYDRLSRRVDAMLKLDEDQLDARDWRDALTAIGRNSEGAT
ncbi:arsenate reductase ArsC [Alteraurantiacibacter aquimixticola]|uniref:Arsenate reductase ArsC n=1 Tax=Alteraurantiacibacter aquimixticola TaxID=2489173 RepID=A0A4T3EZN6_9SPHN|nr:arsenate reductase ArsC [Alteraurantiacibacter aquimixticola]TIX49392.1 arsenate reductase ArsC [Alteraurantiacibacter aquimixticola]